jgi:carboxypeptidase PM20D1
MPGLIPAVLSALLVAASINHAEASPAERLGEAVRIQTVSYQDKSQINYAEFERFHEFLRGTYPRVFGELDVEVVNDYSLLIRWPGSDSASQPILFTAHMDVVPIEPGTEQDWRHPAFDGVVADERIYGRGTLDDKEGLLSILEAAETLLAEGFVPRRAIVFAFGHDEEIGGKQGAGVIAERLRELGLHFEWMVDEGGMLRQLSPAAG